MEDIHAMHGGMEQSVWMQLLAVPTVFVCVRAYLVSSLWHP
jgi:hypothetical protein